MGVYGLDKADTDGIKFTDFEIASGLLDAASGTLDGGLELLYAFPNLRALPIDENQAPHFRSEKREGHTGNFPTLRHNPYGNMIRLFSKLRKTQISAENVYKYLIYAIGEISLIVIGILIAFSIDNWKEKQERKDQEIKILKELHSGLIADSVDIVGNIATHIRVKNACYHLADVCEKNLPWHDSLKDVFKNSCFNTIFNHSTGAYTTLKSKGLDLISNDSLRHNINVYYDQRIGFNLELQSFSIGPQYAQLMEMQRDRLKNFKLYFPAEPWDFEALKRDRQYQSELTLIGSMRSFQAYSFKALLKHNKQLINEIAQELERNESMID